jgi:hypothetical protein
MDEQEIKTTDIWSLYNKCNMFASKHGFYTDTDRNNNFYNGDQWEGLIIEGIEPVCLNFIKPIVNYKCGKIAESLRAINYNADNVDGTEFRLTAKKVCDLLTKRAARVWESDQMDDKLKKLIKKSAINGEAIMYVSYDDENKNPVNEILNKVDVYYGNENDSDIQSQPYILVKQRISLLEAQELAKSYEVNDKDIELIMADSDNEFEAGEDAKDELDNMVTIITKFYRSGGTVWFAKSTKYVDIKKDTDMGTKLYPIAHMLWEEREGSARGTGQVKNLIPNQIETNKTLMRRLLTAKNVAYPQKVYLDGAVQNPDAINKVGGTIRVDSANLDDVKKAFMTTNPAQMSPDVEKIQQELISTTRELENASDTATGQVNPEDASGRAILAVQQASQQPLNDQNASVNTLCEDLARIWLDMWKTYNEGMNLEDIQTDPQTGEDVVKIEKVKGSVLEKLKTIVKIDITPKGAYDKYAQEISLENLAKTELFMNNSWLEDYVSILPDDSTMPKLPLQELLKKRKEAQERIRQIQNQGDYVKQLAEQLINTGGIAPSNQSITQSMQQ